jgi:hypothetical protein
MNDADLIAPFVGDLYPMVHHEVPIADALRSHFSRARCSPLHCYSVVRQYDALLIVDRHVVEQMEVVSGHATRRTNHANKGCKR